MLKTQKLAVLLCTAATLVSLVTAPVSAVLLKSPGTEATAAIAPGTAATTATDTKSATSSLSTGAFTGSTPLSQFLYEKLSNSPATLSIPTSKLNAKSTQAMFTELGDAIQEACLQNGLTDHLLDMNFSYTPGKATISVTLSYHNRDAATRQVHKTALLKKADEIVAQITTADMTTQQKAEALFAYTSNNVTYDFSALEDFIDKPEGSAVYARQTAYAALVEGKAICQGFSRAYKLLCDRAGVPCVVIFGQVRSNGIAHSWNRVTLDGQWVTVDTSNRQLNICAQNGIYISDATASAALTANKESLVDSKANLY